MRKLFCFSILLAVILIAGNAWADAVPTSTLTPKSGKLDFLSGGAVAVTDQTNGYTQRVDSDGAGYVMEKAKSIYEGIGSGDIHGSGAGVAAVSGACRLYTIIYGGPTAGAGEYILIYDAASATGTPKFDISIAVAYETKVIDIPGGAAFETGIFLEAGGTSSPNVITLIYDN
jgi:hypothetical protein